MKNGRHMLELRNFCLLNLRVHRGHSSWLMTSADSWIAATKPIPALMDIIKTFAIFVIITIFLRLTF